MPNNSFNPTAGVGLVINQSTWAGGGLIQALGARRVFTEELEVSEEDLRPPVWVGHVVLETNRMQESSDFMLTIGMRLVFRGTDVSIFELRGGTHLILVAKPEVALPEAPFDLMVEDLRATHLRFTSLGLAPTPIESVPNIDHELFKVREPAGHMITFYSNHVSGKPV